MLVLILLPVMLKSHCRARNEAWWYPVVPRSVLYQDYCGGTKQNLSGGVWLDPRIEFLDLQNQNWCGRVGLVAERLQAC